MAVTRSSFVASAIQSVDRGQSRIEADQWACMRMRNTGRTCGSGPEDAVFEKACKNIQKENEARVIQDISRLVVPSAETLAPVVAMAQLDGPDDGALGDEMDSGEYDPQAIIQEDEEEEKIEYDEADKFQHVSPDTREAEAAQPSRHRRGHHQRRE